MVKLRRTDKRAQNNLKERGDWHQTFQEILRVARAYMQLRSDERRHPNLTADMAGTPGGTSERLFYEHAIRALGWQFNSGDALDAKTATWFTLVTVLLPLVAAILGAEHSLLTSKAGLIAAVIAVAGTCRWGFIVRLLYQAYAAGQWDTGPGWSQFESAAKEYDEATVSLANGHYIATISIVKNENLLRRKALLLDEAVRAFPFEVGLFALSVLAAPVAKALATRWSVLGS